MCQSLRGVEIPLGLAGFYPRYRRLTGASPKGIGAVLPYRFTVPCYPFILRCRIPVPCYRTLLPYHITVPCYRTLLPYRVTVPYYRTIVRAPSANTPLRCPGGTSFCSDPEVFFPVPRNAEWPDDGRIFKSPDLTPEWKEPDPRSETTTAGLTATLREETMMPEPSHGGEEQEVAGR
ncbi:hypothetical protein NDU88_000929 [Pleurodeles waltl]|uniref:Uncharacterized protein n=1 Tax=Pleurodeles waltl TaxID=8319 RepID=A0AAV7MI93_PLEWA|nr:hypothetical protein NDU88_000929 [Pleurodeles waltl]